MTTTSPSNPTSYVAICTGTRPGGQVRTIALHRVAGTEKQVLDALARKSDPSQVDIAFNQANLPHRSIDTQTGRMDFNHNGRALTDLTSLIADDHCGIRRSGGAVFCAEPANRPISQVLGSALQGYTRDNFHKHYHSNPEVFILPTTIIQQVMREKLQELGAKAAADFGYEMARGKTVTTPQLFAKALEGITDLPPERAAVIADASVNYAKPSAPAPSGAPPSLYHGASGNFEAFRPEGFNDLAGPPLNPPDIDGPKGKGPSKGPAAPGA